MKNSISITALSEFVHEITDKPQEGKACYGIELTWQTGTRSRVKALPMVFGTHKVNRDFEWEIDEPRQLTGTNQAANPQEYLLAALAGCVSVGFTVGASVMGIELESLKIKAISELDLAGFLATDASAPVGLRQIDLTIEVAGSGSQAQFEQLKQQAIAHSPNAMTLMSGVNICGQLVVKSHQSSESN